MKKIIVTILIIICASLLMLGLVGCVDNNNQSSSGEINATEGLHDQSSSGEIGATEGLHYQKIAGKQEYALIGLGLAEEIDIVIPSTYKGLPVTKIGNYAFMDCSGLTSVVIGDSVTSIGDLAFSGCTSLTSVVIPNSVTEIGSSAFRYCWGLKEVNYLGTIDQWAQIEFSGSSANPLYYTKQLKINGELVTEVNLTTATKISNYAFFECSNLTSVVIPNSVTSIGGFAFSYCSGLKNIYYTGTQQQWKSISKGRDWNYNTGSYTITYNYTGE